MREPTMLKIGEFARVGQVSIATLRHYEKSGLLKPNALDPETGYRYYSLDQLPRLNRILALKDLGFPLEQISQLLEEDLDLSLDQLRGMFILKQRQTQQMIDIEQARLIRIVARLRQIEQEGNMPTMAYTIHTGADLFLGQAYAALYCWLKDSGYQVIGPPRHVHLQRAEHMEPSHYVTEVQLPIKKQEE